MALWKEFQKGLTEELPEGSSLIGVYDPRFFEFYLGI